MKEIMNENEHHEWNQIDKVATGKNIRRLCEENGISRKYLTAILGLTSVQAVDHYFSGNNLPSTESLVIMSVLFNASIEDILVLKGDLEGLLRNTSIEFDDENDTINNTLFMEYHKKGNITTLKELGDIWYYIPEASRNDIRKRIFDRLLSGGSVKDYYIQNQLQIAFEYANDETIRSEKIKHINELFNKLLNDFSTKD